MKSFKQIALSAMLTLGAFGAVTYTSCNKDECKDVVCENGGTCSGGNCNCPVGYEGDRCEIVSSLKMLGDYNGNETCDVGSDDYNVEITAHSNVLSINIKNIYNQSFTAVGTVTGTNTFTFQGSSGSTSYTGSGEVDGNTLTLEYDITSPLASNSCTFIGTK